MFKLKALSQVIAATVATSFLVGCGSGSSSGSDTTSSGTTEVSGSVFASYVEGAKVSVTDGRNVIAGPVKTDAMGGFKISIANAQLENNLFFVAEGGSYTDEATGTAGVNSERLAVYAGANTLGSKSSINATPASTLIERLIDNGNGLEEAKAKEHFEKAFGYLPDTSVVPVDATKDNAGASDAAKLAGVRAAAFSQLLENLDLEAEDHKALLDALAEDLLDGDVDGMNGAASVQLKGGDVRHDMASQFAVALMDFSNDADKNKSGLSLGQLGSVPFISKAESDNYSFELTPKGMVKEGKVTFDVTIKNPDSPVQGVMPMMMPMMYMASGHMHSTPSKACSMTNAMGVAECTVYFLMPSAMGNGDVMGNWDLMFSVGMNESKESVHFFPEVMMNMSDDTTSLTFKGEGDDTYKNMMGMATPRPYFVFEDSLMKSGDKHTLKLFVGTRYSMTSHPELTDEGTTEDGALKSAPVQLFVGSSASDVTTEAVYTDGLWVVTDIDWLADGEQGSIFVSLNVDGIPKALNDAEVGELKLTPAAPMPMNGSM